MNFSDRLDYLRVEICRKIKVKGSVNNFMEEVFKGYATTNYARWKKKGSIPKRHLNTLEKKYGVNPNWLNTGEGEPFATSGEDALKTSYTPPVISTQERKSEALYLEIIATKNARIAELEAICKQADEKLKALGMEGLEALLKG